MTTITNSVNVSISDIEAQTISVAENTPVHPYFIINNDIPRETLIKRAEDERLFKLYMKLFVVFIIGVFTIPFIVADFYYAYSDTSCSHNKPGPLAVDLFTYLLVDGIMGGTSAIIWFQVIFSSNINSDNFMSGVNSSAVIIFIVIGSLFGLAWTVTGSIIFWNLIDNKTCDKGIYNYVFAQLLIRYIFYAYNLLKKNTDN